MQKIPFLISLALLGLVAGQASAQTLYKCKDADGTVQYSDRRCKGGVPVRAKAQPDSPELKAESDARIQRDKALASQAEASRIAREESLRAAQSQQQQSNQSLTNTVEQERAQQRATTNSVDTTKPVTERRN